MNSKTPESTVIVLENQTESNDDIEQMIGDEIRRIKASKQRPDSKSIAQGLLTRYGLSKDETSKHINQMVEAGKIIKTYRNNKETIRVNDDETKIDSVDIAGKQNEEETEERLGYIPESKSPTPMVSSKSDHTALLHPDINYWQTNGNLVGDLIQSLSRTNELLQQERELTLNLLKENYQLKMQIMEKAHKENNGTSEAKETPLCNQGSNGINQTRGTEHERKKRKGKSTVNSAGNSQKADADIAQKSNEDVVAKSIDESHKGQAKEKVVILGDSMLKNIHGWKLGAAIKRRVIVRSFPGAKTSDMMHYAKPAKEDKANVYIMHCGTNDLSSTASTESIAENIIETAMTLHTDNSTVLVSGVCQRGDHLNEKVNEVNQHLYRMCNARNIGFVNHDNIDPQRHLNGSKVHLNRFGDAMMAKNLRQAMENC